MDSLYLSDGTKIILAENTAVRYPAVLGKDSRQITLIKGQAFFKVHRDVKRPFHVMIGQSKVSVLGTSFNINYSPSAIQLAVKTGKVMFSPNEVSSSAVLVAGQALNYDLGQQRIEWKSASNANSWMTKELEFVDMPLEEVCRQLSAYYHVSIIVHDQMRTAKKFNAHFKDSTLPEIFRVLKQTYRIRIDSNDHAITIKNL
ncbi:MAG TPA: FecR domain-containing protein [Pedobacter sp.]